MMRTWALAGSDKVVVAGVEDMVTGFELERLGAATNDE